MSRRAVAREEGRRGGAADAAAGAAPTAAAAEARLRDPARLLPTGKTLAELCEGSDGEEWDEASAGGGDYGARRQRRRRGGHGRLMTPRSMEAAEVRAAAAAGRPLWRSEKQEAALVTAQRVVAGELTLWAHRLVFVPDVAAWEAEAAAQLERWKAAGSRGERPADRPPRDKEWELRGLVEVHRRRYLLRPSACELFFRDGPPVFVNLKKKKRRRDFINRLRAAVPSAQLTYVAARDLKAHVTRAHERWQRRELTNFEYLMRLNTLAGRTYNDLNQYPVFPWVLADYASETLDLESAATFRDLAVPMGAQRPERAEAVRERYEQMGGIEMHGGGASPPPFHYGSHYSSAGAVLFYLLRLEPFTTLAIRLQGGVFDHADRLFHDVGATYRNATTNSADVKEAIPELYYLPEALVNANGVALGVRQDGTALGDVVLPPWANGSAHDFVRLHRAALESAHVSAHLHEWVDLVFGHKQRGKAAVAALNVFYYLTYEGEVDLDKISDEHERAATEAQIVNCGNTPTQPSPTSPPRRAATAPTTPRPSARRRPTSAASARRASRSRRRRRSTTSTSSSPTRRSSASARAPTASTPPSPIAASRRTRGSRTAAQGAPPLGSTPPPTPSRLACRSPARSSSAARRAVRGERRRPLALLGRLLDRSLRCSHVSTGNTAQRFRAHADVVTCVALSDGHTLVTGSRDTTLMVWALHDDGGGGGGGMGFGPASAARPPRRRASSRRGPPRRQPGRCPISRATCSTATTASSASRRARRSTPRSRAAPTARRSSSSRAASTCTIAHPAGGGGSTAVDLVALGGAGVVVLYSLSDLTLHATTINHRAGDKPLASADACERLSALVLSGGGDALHRRGQWKRWCAPALRPGAGASAPSVDDSWGERAAAVLGADAG